MSPPLRNLPQVQDEFCMPCYTASNSLLIAVYSLRTFSINKTQSFPNEWETLVGMNGSPWISWCSRPNGLHISCQNLELDPNNFSASSSQGWQCWHHIYISSAEQRENVLNILIVVVQVFDQLPNKTEVAKITQSEEGWYKLVVQLDYISTSREQRNMA